MEELGLVKNVTHLFNRILELEEYPGSVNLARLYHYSRSAKKRCQKSVEAINFLNTTLNVLTKIINLKLTSYADLADEQQGFRSCRSCGDAILLFRKLLQKSESSITLHSFALYTYKKHSIRSN